MSVAPFIFKSLEQTQARIKDFIKSIDLDTINTKAPGLNNTIAWNLGHLIVTSHLLTYKLSGLDMRVNLRYLVKFKKGSEGNVQCTEAEIEDLLKFHQEHLSILKADLIAGKFTNFEIYETSYGTVLETIDDAITFTGIHEALHLGYMMALRRALGK